MITAVDTSVLLKILKVEAGAHVAIAALENAAAAGSLIVSPVVVAELGRYFQNNTELERFLSDSHLSHIALDAKSALVAATIMREYAKNKGARSRVAADFLIGAHAMTHANQLLTADAGFMRQYFKTLVVINP